jgi:AraC-like DNA-binding protein
LKLLAGAACLCKEGSNSILRFMKADTKEHRAGEKVEVLIRLRRFAERSKWTKARLSRELGVSVSTVERWLDGQENIFLASVLAIRRFLEEREFRVEAREDVSE